MTKCLFYLRRDGYEVYVGKNPAVILPFDASAVANLEVLDPALLKQALQSFLETSHIAKHETLIILADEVLFHKTFPLEKTIEHDQEIKKFFEIVPINPDQLVQGSYSMGTGMLHFGVNRQLYIYLKQILEQLVNTVSGIYPAFLFGLTIPQAVFGQQASLTADQVEVFWAQQSKFKNNNLLSRELPVNEEVLVTKQGFVLGDKKRLIAVSAFVLVGAAIFFYAIWISLSPLFIRKKPVAAKPATVATEALPTAQPESPTPVQTVDRTALRFHVLNGSGVAGQATKVRDALTPLGYAPSQFVLDNTTQNLPSQSQLLFNSTVSVTYREELAAELKKSFPLLSASESAELGDFDIVITTVK